MRTRQEAIDRCLIYADAYEDYPFGDPSSTAMRHQANQKIFALILEYQGQLLLNLKAEPLRADFWRSVFPAVIPAYHMNKTHWISVILDGSMADEDIQMLIDESYQLTLPKVRARKIKASE